MHNASFPQVIDAATLAEYDADPILAAPSPAITNAQTVSRDGVVQDALGNWVWAWAITDLPAEAIAANLISDKALNGKPSKQSGSDVRLLALKLIQNGITLMMARVFSNLAS